MPILPEALLVFHAIIQNATWLLLVIMLFRFLFALTVSQIFLLFDDLVLRNTDEAFNTVSLIFKTIFYNILNKNVRIYGYTEIWGFCEEDHTGNAIFIVISCKEICQQDIIANYHLWLLGWSEVCQVFLAFTLPHPFPLCSLEKRLLKR